MKKMIVVAHPDDEILFFSSLLEKVNKIIVCFGPSRDKKVSEGRKLLQNRYPLNNIEWLNIKQSNTYLSTNWNNPNITNEGLRVRRNEYQYKQNFVILVESLKSKLAACDEVFTHNPWGEYGHEEHISVFKAVCAAVNESKTFVYVSSYISNRSKNVFDQKKNLLKSDIIIQKIPKKLCESIKKLYILTGCWTFDDDYAWPDSELFIRVETCVSSADEKLWTSTANPPVMFLTKSFKRSLPRLILGKILPQKYKEYFKIIIKRLSK